EGPGGFPAGRRGAPDEGRVPARARRGRPAGAAVRRPSALRGVRLPGQDAADLHRGGGRRAALPDGQPVDRRARDQPVAGRPARRARHVPITTGLTVGRLACPHLPEQPERPPTTWRELTMSTGNPRPLISVDSHVVEPKDLWLKRLPKRFLHQAPQVKSTERGDFFIVPNTGMSPKPVGTEGAMINTKINGV